MEAEVEARINLIKEISRALEEYCGSRSGVDMIETKRESMNGTLVDQETLGAILEHNKSNGADINYASEYWSIYQQKYGFTVVDVVGKKVSLFVSNKDREIVKYFEGAVPFVDDYKAALTSVKYLSESDGVFADMAKKELAKIRNL